MQRYRQLQCAPRQRAPGSPTLAHSAFRQHPLFTNTLSIIVFVGNVYFFHSNLSFPQPRSSRQPAQGREKMKSSTFFFFKKKEKKKQSKMRPKTVPGPARAEETRIFYFLYFFSAPVILLIIHHCLSSLSQGAGCVDAR